jgi:hypothetical protein
MTDKRIRKLESELERLRRRHADLDRSAVELERLGSPQLPLITASRDSVAKKIASIERRLLALRDDDATRPSSEAPSQVQAASPAAPPRPAAASSSRSRRRKPVRAKGKARKVAVRPSLGLAEPELAALRKLAADCDTHAAALALAVKELHHRITQARMVNNGRGPSGMMVTSVLERCWAAHAVGTCLRSMRGPLAQQRTFKDQIMQWEKLLRPAVDPAPAIRTSSACPPLVVPPMRPRTSPTPSPEA